MVSAVTLSQTSSPHPSPPHCQSRNAPYAHHKITVKDHQLMGALEYCKRKHCLYTLQSPIMPICGRSCGNSKHVCARLLYEHMYGFTQRSCNVDTQPDAIHHARRHPHHATHRERAARSWRSRFAPTTRLLAWLGLARVRMRLKASGYETMRL